MTKPQSKQGATPGPWEMNGYKVFSKNKTCLVADVNTIGYPMEEQAIPNARLIASAPELLHALKRLCAYGQNISPADHPPTAADWAYAEAAIAKSERGA